jgi:hypothetical protein
MSLPSLALLLLLALAGTPRADAALLVRDLNTAGDGLLTYDTVTGLEWLDLSVSKGRAPGAAAADYPGFRMAYRGEVEALFQSAGIPANNINDNVVYLSDLAAGQLLISRIGATESFFNGAAQMIYGRVLRANNVEYDVYEVQVRIPPVQINGTGTQFIELGNTLTAWQSNHADFLVRQGSANVPEPASLGLVGAALVAIGWQAWRQRRA